MHMLGWPDKVTKLHVRYWDWHRALATPVSSHSDLPALGPEAAPVPMPANEPWAGLWALGLGSGWVGGQSCPPFFL